MCYVKQLFFGLGEWVLQYHPPAADNISFHPYCLHLWRPQGTTVPVPPTWMIAPTASAT
jgi:hypothetical protein